MNECENVVRATKVTRKKGITKIEKKHFSRKKMKSYFSFRKKQQQGGIKRDTRFPIFLIAE